MRAFGILVLSLALAAATQAAPAPLAKRQGKVPGPERVLAALRAEGFDVAGLRHESGDRWTIDQRITALSGRRRSTVVVRRLLVAPGDPTDKLREALQSRTK